MVPVVSVETPAAVDRGNARAPRALATAGRDDGLRSLGDGLRSDQSSAGRYGGRWYEQARLDHAFERGLTDVSATYESQPDGSVRVVNRGFEPTTGMWRQAIGRALFTGDHSTGSLKVSFFGPFYGGYHVAALDPDYRWALVVGPDRSYCWILARDKHLDPVQRESVVARARGLGIDTAALICGCAAMTFTVVWFKRDLRGHDHAALLYAPAAKS